MRHGSQGSKIRIFHDSEEGRKAAEAKTNFRTNQFGPTIWIYVDLDLHLILNRKVEETSTWCLSLDGDAVCVISYLVSPHPRPKRTRRMSTVPTRYVKPRKAQLATLSLNKRFLWHIVIGEHQNQMAFGLYCLLVPGGIAPHNIQSQALFNWYASTGGTVLNMSGVR